MNDDPEELKEELRNLLVTTLKEVQETPIAPDVAVVSFQQYEISRLMRAESIIDQARQAIEHFRYEAGKILIQIEEYQEEFGV